MKEQTINKMSGIVGDISEIPVSLVITAMLANLGLAFTFSVLFSKRRERKPEHRSQLLVPTRIRNGLFVFVIRFLLVLPIMMGYYFYHNLSSSKAPAPITYECPKSIDKATNDIADYFDYYAKWNHRFLKQNGLQDFRDQKYGGRENTYNWMKKAATKFKAKHFGNELESGDAIYESACGEGFNLLLTVEILKEKRNITNLVVYGNDYLAASTSVANQLLDQQSRRHWWITKGTICQGDSTSLRSFVPSSTFDLVYTGALDPLIDPLRLHDDEQLSQQERTERSIDLCTSNNPRDIALEIREQSAQEDWHAHWTQEMLRIVKPGKLVIIEDVGDPICVQESEWGGVDMSWWKLAAKRYNWDVDIDSIQIVDTPWYNNRYNVIMRRANHSTE